MKKLLLILSLFILSCSTDTEETCDCTKYVYEYNQYTYIDSNGLPHVGFEKVDLYSEVVNCQDEQEEVSNGDNTYFDIVCQ